MGLSATHWEPRKAWLSPGPNLLRPNTQPPQPGSSSASTLSRLFRKRAYPGKNQRIGGEGKQRKRG